MNMEEKRKKMRALRIGTVNTNREGQQMVVLDYINNKNVLVGFDTGGVRNVEWRNFKLGTVTDWMFPAVCGVGMLGNGEYNGVTHKKALKHWRSMIARCYNKSTQEKNPSYKGCAVCEEWHNFQNFAKWYDENYYEVNGEKMSLDKDILVKWNKLYSPETCIFVSSHINSLFIKYERKRGKLPIGVSYNNQSNKYQVIFRKDGKLCQFGIDHESPTEAFKIYKKEKEKHIKEIAERYKDEIPNKLYNVMYSYKVEITD